MNLPKTIAVDFDGTLCENKYPKIGEPKTDVISRLISEQANGAKIILWTCREGKLLAEAVKWCNMRGIYFDAVNENIKERIDFFKGDLRKIGADEYLDDKAVKV